ncbi:hypothetical protein HYH02_004769 [Chlamydomonas schloesseri]|uniref:HECT-type E3 ubiquitin transferase n=1 Tax=Chlamydomonas schloesseri TaxID=2026947 RepID=A0A835WN37_9CHLO|nr:hypothetical protein HYH02_004769 [Chlamydomonas schloesseri]|eukprot:KAG2450258.1 hypothetical protein HYH02_004769 [Chlamydomonas schloesseri]
MDEDKELAEMFARGGAGSALQGLLRKLGAGFEDVMPMGMSGSRLKAIMTGLRQMDDEVAQLSALSELNELLSISTEDNLATFPIESMVPLLIQLLNAEHNPDIMLMAARALTFLADVLPQSCSAIVRHGAVPAFCARLLTIEYIDLAEQSLQALEKLSHEHSPSLLQDGGLLAVLSYLDFFPTGVQRTATATAANICRSLTLMPSAAASSTAQAAVKEAIPILTGLLHYSDAKVVDNACVSLSYIAEASAGQPALLEALTAGGLVAQALQLIGLSDTGAMTSQLSLSTYYGLLKLLSTAAASSAAVATTLLGAGVLATLRTLLATSPLLMAGPGGGGASALLRTPDQLYDVMGLLHEVLPPVADSQALMAAGAAVELPGQGGGAGSSGGSGGRSGGAASRGPELQAYLAAHPPLTAQLCGDILPLVLSSYSATVLPEVRSRALRVLLQLLTACPAAQLRESLRDLPLASFLASLLAGRDTPTCAAALHCCEVLMAQLPDVFKHVFLKEGVAHAIEQLAAPAAAGASGAGSPAPPPPLGAPPNAHRAPSPTADEGRRVTRSASARADDKGGASPGAPPPASAAGTAAAAAARAIPSSPSGLTLRASLAARALRFQKSHYDAGCGAPQTEGLLQVRALLQQLPATPSSTLTELLALMAASSGSTASATASPVPGGGAPAPGGVSVFELLNSGAVKSLYDFLTGADLPPAAPGSAAAADERANAVLRRIAALTRAGLTPTAGSPCNPPLVGLVRKLQAALSSTENFPVYHGRAAPPPGSGSFRSGGMYGSRGGSMGSAGGALQPGSLSSGLSMLTHPFKLRLCRHPSDNSLRDYSSNIVLIEPLATMAAIEEFLWPRVYRGVAPGSAPPPPQPQQAQAQQPAAADQRQAGAVPGTGTGTAGGNAAGAAAAAGGGGAAGTRSHPIPVDDSAAGNRRVTRAQAARERAEAEAATRRTGAVPVPTRGNRRSGGGGTAGDAGPDARMSDPDELKEPGRLGRRRSGRREVGGDAAGAGAGGGAADSSDPELDDDGHDSGDGDADMDDAAGGDAMFDEDDEDFDDDAMEGDDGDAQMGTMTVHDLHVDQDPAGGRGAQPPAGAAGAGQQSAGAAAAAAAAAAATAAAKSGSAAAAAAAATTRPTGAWGNRAAGGAAAAPSGGAAATAPPGDAAAPGSAGQGAGGAARSAAHEAAPARMAFVLGSSSAAGTGAGGDGRQPLSSACTVFQAIQQLQNQQQQAGGEDGDEDGEEEGGGGGQRRGRRLWEEIHTLYYRPATPADASAADSNNPGQTSTGRGAAESGGSAAGGGSVAGPLGRWANTPLRELLSPRVPADVSCSSTCREVLALLALLEAVNRLGPRACAELDAAGAGGAEEQTAGPLESTRHAARDEFVSAKLSSKLGQQLKDVLAICGGGMPAWCNSLVGPCRFLFPFEIRKRYFYCTAFGLGRALQHMQQLHTAEAGGALAAAADRDGRELRVGRLQRQKVRVSRKRILDSAAKVMELYARSRAVLELEYFNEVGTGLGPTLEFYTLLSHELQRKDLGMWRHEEQDDTQKQQQQADKASGAEDTRAKSSAPTPGSPDRMDVDGEPPGAIAAAAQGQGRSTPPRVQSGAVLSVSVPSRRGEAADHDECEYVNAPWGLFPRPLPPASLAAAGGAAAAKVVEHFRLLGRTLAKALQDNRLLDLPLSHVFFAAALGSPLDMWDISRLDPGLGATLARLHAALAAHRAGGGAGPLLVDGVPLEDLCITFVLPGQPDYPLRPGGGEVVVSTPAQLAEYIGAVTDATLGSGIAAQMGAFREGFNEVFSLSTVSIFNEDEIEVLLCGSGERWTLQALSEAIKFDHGYTANSQPVKYLLEILSELDAADQRAFLRFVTGCPRLPPGGLTALQPRLTVVRKHPSGGEGPSNGPTPVGSFQEVGLGGAAAALCAADADLPSVMTCANYIKLPPYSSKAVMAARLMYAIREGQGSFDLS